MTPLRPVVFLFNNAEVTCSLLWVFDGFVSPQGLSYQQHAFPGGRDRALVHTHLSVPFFLSGFTDFPLEAALLLSMYFSQLSLPHCPSIMGPCSVHLQLPACEPAVPSSLLAAIKSIPKVSIRPHKYLEHDPSSSAAFHLTG